MGVLAIILFEIGLSLGWVYLFMGIAIGGAVAPIYMALVWSKASAVGAITGAFSGLGLGLIAWLVTCQGYYGKITIDNLGGDYPMLAGNLASILGSLVICSVISLIKVGAAATRPRCAPVWWRRAALRAPAESAESAAHCCPATYLRPLAASSS